MHVHICMHTQLKEMQSSHRGWRLHTGGTDSANTAGAHLRMWYGTEIVCCSSNQPLTSGHVGNTQTMHAVNEERWDNCLHVCLDAVQQCQRLPRSKRLTII